MRCAPQGFGCKAGTEWSRHRSARHRLARRLSGPAPIAPRRCWAGIATPAGSRCTCIARCGICRSRCARRSRMDFRSDNAAGYAPEILAALAAANDGARTPYGEDEQTRRVQRRLQELFEADFAVFLVATGTAANALGLSLLTPAWGTVLDR